MDVVKEGIVLRRNPPKNLGIDFIKYVASDMCIGVTESKDPALRKIIVTKNTRRLTDNQT